MGCAVGCAVGSGGIVVVTAAEGVLNFVDDSTHDCGCDRMMMKM